MIGLDRMNANSPVIAMSDDALRVLEQTYPPIVTTAQVAEILDLNPRTVMLMANDGRLPASRIPGSRSYRFFWPTW